MVRLKFGFASKVLVRARLIMKRKKRSRLASSLEGNTLRALDGEMEELFLLLPKSQAALLEEEASRQGLTPGQLARSIIRDFFLCQTVFHRN